MFKSLFFLFAAITLYAQSASSAVVIGAHPYTTLYPIDIGHKGTDIVKTVNALYTSPYLVSGASDVVLQTVMDAYYTSSGTSGTKGLIPFVQPFPSNFLTPHNTLLIVTYSLTQNANVSTNQYVILPVEKVTEIIYSNTTISNSSVFSATVPSGTIPFYQINMMNRAIDIQSVVQKLNGIFPFYNFGNQKVTIQTTLSGPYYSSTFVNGLIPQVQSVNLVNGPNGTYMIVYFLQSNIMQYVVVSPEQVTAITWSRI